MSAKRPAAPVEQTAIKRARKPEDMVNETSRHSTGNVVPTSKHTQSSHATGASGNVKQPSSLRVVGTPREASSHSSSHGAVGLHSSASGLLSQKVPRAAHSGAVGSLSTSTSVSTQQRSSSSNAGSSLTKTSTPTNAHAATSSFNALKQSMSAQSPSQASSAALASLLPLLYGTSSSDKNLEVAAAQLASGALKQAASGQSQSLLSGLAGLPLGNLNLTNLNTLLNYQMVAAMQKLTAPASSAASASTPSAKKESMPSASNSHAHSTSGGTHTHARSSSSSSSFAKPSPAASSQQLASLGAPLNLATSGGAASQSSAASGSASLHHTSQPLALGMGDAPIDLSKKTASPAHTATSKSRPTATPSGSRPDSAVPSAADSRTERESARPAESPSRSNASEQGSVRERERDRDRDRDRDRSSAQSQSQADKVSAPATNGEAERQIPVITLSDDEATSDDDDSNGLFDDELAQVENLAAPLSDDGDSPLDRAALMAARKRLVRELRRTLCDEEARTELLRRWNTHNVTAARDQAAKPGATLNGKLASTQPQAANASLNRTSKSNAVQPPGAKRDVLASRTGTATAASNGPQPAHAHGSQLNGAATPAHGGPPSTPTPPGPGGNSGTSVPLKVPRLGAPGDMPKSASSASLTTTPRGPQSTPNATPTGKPLTNSTSSTNAGSSQKQSGAPQLSAAQLQAQLAASKLALRKQVEKMLAQLAPPKPASAGADIQFVPSVNYTDLLCLVGLDETVNALQRFEAASSHSKSAIADAASNGVNGSAASDMPSAAASHGAFSDVRTCIQCETDFTPSWHVAERALLNAAAQKRLVALRDAAPKTKGAGGTSFYVCERCAVHNQKKTSRNEYLAKLKQTFSQLARDERELDERYSTLIAQAPQSVPNAASNVISRSSSHSALLAGSLHGNVTPTSTSNVGSRSAAAMHNALKEAQQLLGASSASRGASSPTPTTGASSLGAGLGLPSSPSFSSTSALNAFTAFTAAMSAAANAMKTASPAASAGLNLNAASLSGALGAGLNASALGGGLGTSGLGVGGLNPASLGAALQAFLSLQNQSYAAPASRSAATASGGSASTSASASASASRSFAAQFGSAAAAAAAAAFGVGAQQSASASDSAAKTASDLHRQYYLEMVTKPPVLPSWKK